jgi:hypothetical protein
VEREQFAELDAVLDAVEGRALSLAQDAPRRALDLRYKKLEPVQQVFARVEFAGPERVLPSVRAGIDVRGDGSAEPYLGRLRRRAVNRRPGESAPAALRRLLVE